MRSGYIRNGGGAKELYIGGFFSILYEKNKGGSCIELLRKSGGAKELYHSGGVCEEIEGRIGWGSLQKRGRVSFEIFGRGGGVYNKFKGVLCVKGV